MSNQNQSIGLNESEIIWKEKLSDEIPSEWRDGIDHFETQIFLKKQGKVDDKVFAETRLRRGAYGQRYDNGNRHNGSEDKPLPYPEKDLTKGPNTLWHAPGMLRIKIPYGGMTIKQLEVLAALTIEVKASFLASSKSFPSSLI